MKKVFVVFLSVGLLLGCKNASLKNQAENQVVIDSIKTLSVDEFLASAPEMDGKPVIVTGVVSHVCKHGGQKLFLLSESPEKYLRINTGKGIPEFPVELEGSTIEVKGVVSKFEEAVPEQSESAENDTAKIEQAYHKDNFYVVVADSYTSKDEAVK